MGAPTTKNYWTPKQIGAMHRNLSFNNSRKYLKNTVHNPNKIIVNSDEIWNFDWLLDRDIHIDSLGVITLSKPLQMPFEGKIEINTGGKLLVDNSTIKNPIENHWNGIIVKSGGLLILNSTSIADYNVTVECGGSVIIKGGLIISGEHSLQVFSGGYFCFDNNPIISLTDYLSLIKINEGAINGINPLLSGISTNCGTIPTHTGNGAIADFNQDVYIQNETLSTNRYIGGKNIFVGNHVTTSQTTGDVMINNGANIIFDCKEITFDAGFECAVGSTYEVKNH